MHTYVKEKTFTEANTITHISPITKLMIINVNAWNYIKKQKKIINNETKRMKN